MKVQFTVFKPSKIIHRLAQARPFLQSGGGACAPGKLPRFAVFVFMLCNFSFKCGETKIFTFTAM
jgi:hypothetical protein